MGNEQPPDGAQNPDVADADRLDTEGGRMPQGGVTPATPDQVRGQKTTPSAPERADEIGHPPEGTTGVSTTG